MSTTTIFKARSTAITTVSPDGQLLAAGDYHEHLYVVEIETGNALLEEELDNDVETIRFDRSGKRLFLSDGVEMMVFSVPDFTQLSLPGIDELEDPTRFVFLDSRPEGDSLLFHPDGRLCLIDPQGENYRCLARIFPKEISIDGQYLGGDSNKLTLSAKVRPPRTTVVSILDDGSIANIPSLSEWEEGELLGVAPDGRQAILQNENLIIRDVNQAEISRCKLPYMALEKARAISNNLDSFATSGNDGVYLFDSLTGQEKNFVTTGDLRPINLKFVPRKGGSNKLVGSLSDGTILLLTTQ